MERIFAVIGVLAVLALIAVVIGTLRDLSKNPESPEERYYRLARDPKNIAAGKAWNERVFREMLIESTSKESNKNS